MADPKQLAKLDEGVGAWSQWRAGKAIAPDLSGVDFSGKDLSRADLRGANFTGSDLSGTTLREANLEDAVLRGADLRGVNFSESTLLGASLREANLQGVDLSVAKRGLRTEQLAGADLTGATLPEELKKLYDSLQNVNNISESARKLFLAVLAACLYSWLTIATTTDVNLITNRASSPLPIIQTSIPIVGFYWVAPLLLLCVYFYFHFYLQKLWEELGSLPAILPDGRPLHAKIDPWLLNDLLRAHLPKLNVNRPFLSYFQLWISVLLAWWVVPITMFLFWGRYLARHERAGTAFHVALLVISLTAALSLYRLAIASLRGTERKPLRWKGMLTSRRGYQTAAMATAVGLLFGSVSWGTIMGVRSTAPIFGIPVRTRNSESPTRDTGPLTWVPRLMALVGYLPFANLTTAEVSQKKSTWSRNDEDLDSVVRAELMETNLRYASAYRAFLAGADLNQADLSGAQLSFSDLRGANLSGAHLRGTFLWSAKLEKANLSFADLRGASLYAADLRGADLSSANLQGANVATADLTYSDFRGTRNLNLEVVKHAIHWEEAYYDDKVLTSLGLPTNHNAELRAQVVKSLDEQDLQQKQKSGQTLLKSVPPKQ
jgi:uncharacterized protein YjbI with pentapeptide repeats